MKTLVLKSTEDTKALGAQLAAEAKPNTVIALTGDLGAGKTTLTKSIAKGLGVSETLTSPTFTIVCEYDSGRMPLYHFDVYRVHDSEELFEIGFEDYLHRGGLCVVEWADLLEEDMLPESTIHIKLYYGSHDDERVAEIE